MTETKLPAGYICKCGAGCRFPPYVYAHWDEELIGTCESCERTHLIVRGQALHVDVVGRRNRVRMAESHMQPQLN